MLLVCNVESGAKTAAAAQRDRVLRYQTGGAWPIQSINAAYSRAWRSRLSVSACSFCLSQAQQAQRQVVQTPLRVNQRL